MAGSKAPLTRVQWALASLAALFSSVLWAVVCNFAVEFMQVGGNLEPISEVTFGSGFRQFVLGSLLVWTLLLLVWAVSGRLWVASAVMMSLALMLGYANYQKVTLRLEPLYPSDFQFATEGRFLLGMVGPAAVLGVVAVVLLVTLVLYLSARILDRRWRRTRRIDAPRRWMLTVVTRVVVVTISVTVIFSAAHFNERGNPVRHVYEVSGARWAFWFQQLNYRRNGFVAGLLYNLNTPAMDRPHGYSRAAMKKISAKYAATARDINAHRDKHVLDHYNVVLVLSEAFSDPIELEGVEYAEDPIPHTRRLMAKTTSGRMLAQLFGGGTANMEFEALTGMSLSQFTPQMQTPYSMLVPQFKDFPSAVGLLEHQGHKPIAMHPYMTSMYKREATYPILGFDEFLGEDDFEGAQKIDKSDFISDASAFAQVQRELDRSEEPLLVNLVTMQNHYPTAETVADPLPISGLCCDYKKEAEGYGRGLEHTDDALHDFLTSLKNSDEKTAVVFYGDHQPPFWPQGVRDQNGDVAMRSTPFFIWANTSIDRADTPEITSPIYFMPMLYDALGAQIPPYYALLRELQAEIPAMEQGIYLDDDGNPLERADLSPRAKELLRDYRLVQYDLSVGARYSQDELFYPASVTSAAAQ